MHELPAELRGEVFRHFDLEWGGEMPEPIIVLRPKQCCYMQVLELFYKRGVFCMHTVSIPHPVVTLFTPGFSLERHAF